MSAVEDVPILTITDPTTNQNVNAVGATQSATTLLVKATSTSSFTVYGTATVTVTDIPIVSYTVSASSAPIAGGS